MGSIASWRALDSDTWEDRPPSPRLAYTGLTQVTSISYRPAFANSWRAVRSVRNTSESCPARSPASALGATSVWRASRIQARTVDLNRDQREIHREMLTITRPAIQQSPRLAK